MSSYTTDFDAARAFYLAALAPLGYGVQYEMEMSWDEELPGRKAVAFGPPGKSVFWLIQRREASTPRHTAFAAESRAAVDAFYEAALAAGGRDNGAPGLRPVYHEHYYGGFVIDPDGNDVEAVCHRPE